MLGFGWDEVHHEAEVLEHHLSERVTDALDRLMDYPQFDPHGEAIPSKKGKVGQRVQIPLSEVDEGATVLVVRVDPRRNEVLQYLDELGIGVAPGWSSRESPLQRTDTSAPRGEQAPKEADDWR